MKKYSVNREIFVDFDDESLLAEFTLHENWKKMTGLRATPTVLINGYKLPDNMRLEDIIYLPNISM